MTGNRRPYDPQFDLFISYIADAGLHDQHEVTIETHARLRCSGLCVPLVRELPVRTCSSSCFSLLYPTQELEPPTNPGGSVLVVVLVLALWVLYLC